MYFLAKNMDISLLLTFLKKRLVCFFLFYFQLAVQTLDSTLNHKKKLLIGIFGSKLSFITFELD